MNSLTRQINSLFILGYKGQTPDLNLETLVGEDLGGIIFFADNIFDRETFKRNIKKLKEIQSEIILSIDQEGGRVQRTNNLQDAIEYISPLYLCQKEDELIRKHYQILSEELLDFGINMDFAPVLDVYINPDDPIINERAFGKTSEDVIKYAQIQNDALMQNGIKTVGKHFPGHGAASVDSHVDMPNINLSLEQMQDHIEPFRHIKTDGVMVAHVHYDAFDDEVMPASLSSNVINYLKNDVGFEGLIISDDMVMGGISKYFSPLDACIKGIMSGIDMFIFRECTSEILQLLRDLEVEANKKPELKLKIEIAASKVCEFKNNISLKAFSGLDIAESKRFIENIKNSPNRQ